MGKKQSSTDYNIACMINLQCTGAIKKRRDHIIKTIKPICGIDRIFLTYQKSLDNDCMEIAKLNPDILLVGGGDGTFVLTPGRLWNVYNKLEIKKKPIIYYIEMGQENKLGAEIRSSFGPWNYFSDKFNNPSIKNLSKIVHMANHNEKFNTRKISMIKVNNEFLDYEHKGRKKKETFYTFDIAYGGLVTAILEDYYGVEAGAGENLRDEYYLSFIKPGFRDVAKVFLKTVFQQPINYALGFPQTYFKNYMGQLIIDGKKVEMEEFIGLYASTIRPLAVGSMPFHKTNGQIMHLRGGNIHPLQMMYHFNDIYYGRDINNEKWIDITAKKIEFYRHGEGYLCCGGELRPSLNSVATVDEHLEFIVLNE